MIVASWILNVDPTLRGAARSFLTRLPGTRVNALQDPLVVTTECSDGGLERCREQLGGAPGVVTVALVVALNDSDRQEGE